MSAIADWRVLCGPNCLPVRDYITQVRTGFLFNRIGRPHARDGSVHRVRDWGDLRKIVDYSQPDAGPENSSYLRFLVTVTQASDTNTETAGQNGLAAMIENAIDHAGKEFVESEDMSDEFLDFTCLPEYDEPYPFARFSIQDHCSYIAAEFVVAQVSPVHLLRDMWEWYRAGHWPCGWEGNWPEGRLIVF